MNKKSWQLTSAALFVCAFLSALWFTTRVHINTTSLKKLPIQQVRRQPLLIAPVFEGIGIKELNMGDAAIQCGLPAGFTTESALINVLNRLEPGGPKGNVIVGYTMVVPILQLYKRGQKGNWILDNERINFYLNLIRKIDRPVVVYMLANHFSSNTELVKELSSNPINLMVKADGSVPSSRYFSTNVQPFTLSTDETVPVNQYKFQAIRVITSALNRIDQELPGRIAAVTLGGEYHHLFDDLKNRAGYFGRANYTDYSAKSIGEFRVWLQGRYKDITKLNKQMGTHFNTWSKVVPPSRDIRTDKLDGFWQHMDVNANGRLPFFGWIDVDASFKEISFELDGKAIGNAVLGINRMDVYEAKPSILNPNTGFRYDLEVANVEPGIHSAALIARMADGTRQLIVSREFVRMGSGQVLPESRSIKRKITSVLERHKTKLPSFKGDYWLVSPRNLQDVYYNRFAVEWQSFREEQVREHIKKLFHLVIGAGFDRQRVFSHQLLPYLNGSWNDLQFAADRSFDHTKFQPGMTLYGGLTVSELAVRKANGIPYGVPEMNPLLFKNPQEAEHAIQFQYDHDARFISPYYMSLLKKQSNKKGDGHGMFLIEPNNTLKGGNFFFNAIVKYSAR